MALKNFVIYCRLAPKCKYAHQNFEDQKEYRLKKNGFNHFKISWSCKEYQTYFRLIQCI